MEGVHSCKALAKADVRITLIDKRNFHLFQTLLDQVTTGLISKSDVATPLRELLGKQENVQVMLGGGTKVNPEGKQIIFNGKAYSFDHLIRATGSGSTYFDNEDWRTFAPPMNILEHAAMIDHYAHQLSGLPQTQERLDTKVASVADSEAAIK